MPLSHTLAAASGAFDDPNLVSAARLVPLLALAERAGLTDLADEHLSPPTDKGANAGLQVASLGAGMAAGADRIEDMALLRDGGMGRVFNSGYAPSTLGSFLRAFTFGHVRQLDALASSLAPGRPQGQATFDPGHRDRRGMLLMAHPAQWAAIERFRPIFGRRCRGRWVVLHFRAGAAVRPRARGNPPCRTGGGLGVVGARADTGVAATRR